MQDDDGSSVPKVSTVLKRGKLPDLLEPDKDGKSRLEEFLKPDKRED